MSAASWKRVFVVYGRRNCSPITLCLVGSSDTYGMYVCGSRWTKSKMPWEPGSTPVAMLVHDTSVCGGEQTSSREYPPASTNFDRFGILPACCSGSKMLGSNESKPTMIVRMD